MQSLLQNKRLIAYSLVVLGITILLLYLEESKLILALSLGLIAIITLPFFIQNIKSSLLLLVFFTPLSIDILMPGGMKLSAPTELLTFSLLILFLLKWAGGLTLDTKVLKHPISILLILDLCWSIFAALNSEIPAVSYKRVILKAAFIGIYYFLFSQFFTDTKSIAKMYWLYAIGIIIPILSTLYFHSQFEFSQEASILVSQPFFIDHTIYAACLAFILPFITLQLVYGKLPVNKLLVLALLILVIVALLFSYSRAAWISVFVAIAFFFATKTRIKFWQFLASIFILGSVLWMNFDSIYQELGKSRAKYGNDVSTHLTSVTNLQNDASNLERINRWISAYRMFEEKPLNGFGPGTYQFIYHRYQASQFTTRISTYSGDKGNAHSEYFTYLSETGIIGLLIFLSIIIYSFYLAIQLLRTNLSINERLLVYAAILGLVTFYVHGLFNTFMDYEKMSVLYLGSLAVLVNLDLKKIKNI